MPELRQLDGLLLTEPRAIGSYRVVRPIANGGVGTVFLVEGRSGARFAMKALHEHLRTTRLAAALGAEGRLTLGLALENVVCAVDVLDRANVDSGDGRQGVIDNVDGAPAIVMPFVEGQTLDVLAAADRSAQWRVLLDALHGLAACHAVEIVHRDICPSNLLIDATGAGHLIDFGLAWSPKGYVTDPEGGTQGTFAYLAPEQVRAEPPTPQVDVFSCGVIAWEVAAGRRLHAYGNTARTLLDVTGRDAPSLADDCPPALADVIARALARDPA